MSTQVRTTSHRSGMTETAVFGKPFKHPLRVLPAAALVVTGAAHIPVIPAHLHEAPYIGVLFIALTAASFVLAAVLAVHDTAAAYAGTAAVMILAILAYVVSRTVGLPEIGDDIGNWLEPLGVVSVIAEMVAFVGSIAIWLKARNHSGTHTLSTP